MILRKVSKKDYNKVRKLFKRNQLKMIKFNRWNDLWSRNPALLNKKKWIRGWVIEENKVIVGHIGNFPMYYFLNGKNYICSILNGWVVDKKFRSASMILIKKYFSQLNIDFFLGTSFGLKTSKIMEALNVKKVPVEDLDSSLIIILKSSSIIKFFLGNKTFPFKNFITSFFSIILTILFNKRLNYWENKFSTQNIESCNIIDNKFDHLWKKIKLKKKNTLLFQRDKKWLKWHLGPFLKDKKAWLFLSKKNNEITGYSICIEKVNFKKKIKSALIIDLITLNDFKETSKNLIGANIQEAKRRNYDIVEFRGFDKENRSYMKLFKPFKKKLKLNSFYYKSKNKKLDKLLSNDKYWNPSYIDGDAIINI